MSKRVLADILVPEFLKEDHLNLYLEESGVAIDSYKIVRVAAPEDRGKVRLHVRCFDWEAAITTIGFWY